MSSDKPYLRTTNASRIDVEKIDVRPAFLGRGNDLYFCGYVRYTDIFNKRYILGWCFMYQIDSGRFILKGDDRYNYIREEK